MGVPPLGGPAEAGTPNQPPKGGTPSGTPAAALLLLDNVSEPGLLSPAQLATLPGGMSAGWLRIVVTTRLDLRAQKDRLTLLAVDALDEDTALTLLRDHQPPRDAQRRLVADLSHGEPQFASDAEETAAREIVRALGGFTLAVEQVALYLGLHPDVTPSAFLTTLKTRGLPVADTLPQRDPDLAAQMLTQSKQLGLILDATLARLDAPARTALSFAALLPPDTVPWPWLRDLTGAEHPELGERDDLGADPWLAVQRRLTGLRLLTPGDQPEVARIHRLVAAHRLTTLSTANFTLLLEHHISNRAMCIYTSRAAPADWELDSVLLAAPHLLSDHPVHDLSSARVIRSETVVTYQPHPVHSLANACVYMLQKVVSYRTVPAAAALLDSACSFLSRLAASDPANARWQRDVSVSLDQLAKLAELRGDVSAALRFFNDPKAIAERLVVSDPSNVHTQSDFFRTLRKLGRRSMVQGDFAEASRLFKQATN